MSLVRVAAVVAVVATLVTGCGRGAPPGASTPTSAPAVSPAASASPAGVVPSGTASTPPPFALPRGVTAGIAVFDRGSGTFLVLQKPDWRFRSASLVKLLIALDYFWTRGPAYAVAAEDRARMDIMLRGSDDSAATYFWKRAGSRDVVSRMVTRLGLVDTAPPPVAQPGFWGYTALSAADVVRVYRYILDKAPAPVRDSIMGNLARSNHCASDGYDQSFGIPSAYGPPYAVKQGWSGFGDKPAQPCTAKAAWTDPEARLVPAAAPNAIDMSGEVLHTTGTLGADHHLIVAILTVHPDGTRFSTAVTTLTNLTKSLHLQGSA